jgi:predicted HTH transcriptional regulator
VAPPQGQPHAGVNFVQPSPIQQYQNFEQLNMKIHPISQTMPERKEKIITIIIPDQEETRTNPNRTSLSRETRTRGIKTPKGETTKNRGRTKTFPPTSLVPFAVILVTILTISPKLLTLNG